MRGMRGASIKRPPPDLPDGRRKKHQELENFMASMKVDDLIAMLEPYRGKEVYIECAWRNLDIKEVKVEQYSTDDYTNKAYERVLIVPDGGDLFDMFYDD